MPCRVLWASMLLKGTRAYMSPDCVRPTSNTCDRRSPIAEGSARFPLIVFSHGPGLATLAYSIQIEELVSHGYVVAAIDHTYETFATVFRMDE
jgi:predicted dienelactone hydrolase